MTAEIRTEYSDNEEEIVENLASNISEDLDTGSNHLLFIKVCINPKYLKANIYAGYENTEREIESGFESPHESLYETLIKWPVFEKLENTEATWEDLSFPKIQMERALLLSVKLNQELIIVNCTDDLKCYFNNGKAHVDRV